MKKLFLVFLFLFILPSGESFARVKWGKIGACITNPCGCNCSPIKITDYWPSNDINITIPVGAVTKIGNYVPDGVTFTPDSAGIYASGVIPSQSNSYKNECNCPPYGRYKDRKGCLKQFSPINFWNQTTCAEDPGKDISSFFQAKIRVRSQICLGVACKTFSSLLKYNGECVLWPSPTLVSTTRVCARIAVPGSSTASGRSDDGYVTGKHLNTEGYPEPDTLYQDNGDGTWSLINRPKLCAYIDPSAFDVATGGAMDILDINPNKQPFHAGSGLSPIAQIIIAISRAVQDSNSNMIISLLQIAGAPQESITAIKLILGGAGLEGLVRFLKKFGQLNYAVTKHLGCIEIPLGPFPPPYCPVMPVTPTSVSIFKICPTVTKDTGACPSGATSDPCTVTYSDNDPCIESTYAGVSNDVINNSVKIALQSSLPICSDSGDHSTDECIKLSGSISYLFPSVLHVNSKDLLDPSLITNTPALPLPSGQSKFRVIYASVIGGDMEQSQYYNPNLPDCGTDATGQCQVVWGIDVGPSVNLTINFAGAETGYNTGTMLSDKQKLVDPITQSERTFLAAITRSSTLSSTDSNATKLGIINVDSTTGDVSDATQDVSDMCIFEQLRSGYKVVGCVRRPPPSKPTVYSCQSSSSTFSKNGVTVSCPSQTDGANPAIIAVMTVGTSTTAGAMCAPSVNNASDSPSVICNTALNLAGYDMTSFVTDSNYAVAPFSSNNSWPSTIGPCTSTSANNLYGTYLNGPPYDSSGNVKSTASYLYGLEYENGLYSSGVRNPNDPSYKTQICVDSSSTAACSDDNPSNCVLTNLANNNIVDCQDFFSAAVQYSPFRKCGSGDSLCHDGVSEASCTGSSCPAIKRSSCSSTDCIYVDSIQNLSATGTDISIFNCPANSSTGDAQAYCYYYPTMVDICRVTYDVASRVVPLASSGAVLSSSDYFDSKAGVSTTTTTSVPQDDDATTCVTYLSGLSDNPYSSGIQECDATYNNCTNYEYFKSISPSNILLTIKSCSFAGSSTPVYCYSYASDSGLCILSKLLTIRYNTDPSKPSPALSEYATQSSIVANNLLAANSSVSCSNFLSGVSDSYSGIGVCSGTNATCPIVEVLSSSSPNTSVSVRKCSSTNSYQCYYVNPMGAPQTDVPSQYSSYATLCSTPDQNTTCNIDYDLSSTNGIVLQSCTTSSNDYCYTTTAANCTMGCTGANESPYSMSVSDYVALIKSPTSYGSISACDPNYCPSSVQLKYSDGSNSCISTTAATCSLQETINNGTLSVQVNKCVSYNYTITDSSGTATSVTINPSVDGDPSYYCYSADGTLDLSKSVTRTSASGASLVLPNTSTTPNICTVTLPSSDVVSTTKDRTPCSASSSDSHAASYFNKSICIKRDKTAIELGLCGNIPDYPSCSSNVSNNITWPTTLPGQLATGTCANGMFPSGGNSPTQYCFADTTSAVATSSWASSTITGSCITGCDPLSPSASNNYTSCVGSQPGGNISCTCSTAGYPYKNSSGVYGTTFSLACSSDGTYSSTQCTKSQCAAVASSSSTGYASWPVTDPGSGSVAGTCASGYYGTPPTRSCNGNVGAASSWGSVSGSCANCAAITDYSGPGYANWPSGTNGATNVSATCSSGTGATPVGTCTNGTWVITNGGSCSSCAAITTANASSGYATWPKTGDGQTATGTCTTIGTNQYCSKPPAGYYVAMTCTPSGDSSCSTPNGTYYAQSSIRASALSFGPTRVCNAGVWGGVNNACDSGCCKSDTYKPGDTTLYVYPNIPNGYTIDFYGDPFNYFNPSSNCERTRISCTNGTARLSNSSVNHSVCKVCANSTGLIDVDNKPYCRCMSSQTSDVWYDGRCPYDDTTCKCSAGATKCTKCNSGYSCQDSSDSTPYYKIYSTQPPTMTNEDKVGTP